VKHIRSNHSREERNNQSNGTFWASNVQQISALMQQGVRRFVAIREILLRMRTEMPPAQLRYWLQRECGFSLDLIEDLMRVARRFSNVDNGPTRHEVLSMPTSPPAEQRTLSYDDIVDWYHASLEASWLHETVLPTLLEILDAACFGLPSTEICDLCCGTGVLSRELAKRGANVVAVDRSEKMLLRALEEQQKAPMPLPITYVKADVQMWSGAGQSFDAITCNLALMDIAHLEAFAHTVARLLLPGGVFVCSLLHPAGPYTRSDGSLAWRDNYYKEGFWISENAQSVRGQIGAYHRKLSTYIQTFLQCFELEGFQEPQAVNPLPSEYVQFPSALVLSFRKRYQERRTKW
jgi:2-polyprenyl-3-methyl-5-hydroxy-6-metoxy-1,4-benzoquinol methylase